jgi:hypothetical protein
MYEQFKAQQIQHLQAQALKANPHEAREFLNS